jgi:hypothetical protein
MNTFAQLFKRYRLRSEFISLSKFADAFAEKGQVHDTSIFSHWQKGTRIPGKRIVLVTLIEIFIENRAITSLDQANEFLESAGHGYLTYKEQKKIIEKNFQILQNNNFLLD